jgi:rSAM/selenodomain-associated transferase 1
MPSVILLFAKAPLPGYVKTRLCPPLTAEQASDLHRLFVAKTLRKTLTIAPVELHTDIPTDAWEEFEVARKLQCGGSLGERMFAAFDASPLPAVILGSDAPHLPSAHIETLMRSEADVALGPAEDGGFWGIHCRRIHSRMFDGVAWSTARAREQTMRAVRACGLSVELGPHWWDIDTPADLARLTDQDAEWLQWASPGR